MKIVKTVDSISNISITDDLAPGSEGYPKKRAKTRRQLLRAGMAAVAEHGPDGVTVADIAGRADLSSGTFYNHFASVQLLIDAICNELMRAVELANDLLEKSENDPAIRVAVGTRRFIRMTTADALAAQSFVLLLATVPAFRERLRSTVREAVDAGIASGRFVDRSPALTVDAMIGAVTQWMRARLDAESGSETERDYLAMILAIVGLPTAEIAGVVGQVAARTERATSQA